MQMPRVMHVITDLGTYGAERFLVELLSELPRHVPSVGVMLVSGRTAPESLAAIDVFPVGRRGRYDLGFLPRMTGLLRRWKPDIVHTHTHHGKYWGRLAAVAAGVRTVVHSEHNSEFESRFPFTLLNRALHARTDRFVALSSAHGAALASAESIPRDRIAVIANGIRLRVRRPADREAARRLLGAQAGALALLHVGRLAEVKNQRLAIEAVALLPPRLRDRATLYLIGDGTDRAALEASARTLGVSERIVFLGYRTDVADLLPGGDLWLMTSLNEGMPLSLIEAMAAGVPIVSTPWAGAQGMLEDGALGRISADFTPAGFAAAICAALDDPEETGRRALRGIARAGESFSIERTAQEYASLYRSLARG